MGAKVLEQISNDLQKKLPGLRGFQLPILKGCGFFMKAGQAISHLEAV